MDLVADPSPSRSSRKRHPPARSPELLSPKAVVSGDMEEDLMRRVEELEAVAARLRGEKETAEEVARVLLEELDALRASAETGTSETMLMILRLQREKAAAQMEAHQLRLYAEGRAYREREVQDQEIASLQEEIASLSDLAASYRCRLQSHGIDPDSFCDEEEEKLDVEDGEEMEQINLSGLAAERNAGDASTGMEGKAMVVDGDNKEEEASFTVGEFEYTVDVSCASTTKAFWPVVTEYMGDGNAGALYARGEAPDADRMAMRRELAALRAERAQLVMARKMARRLFREMVAEQRAIVDKTAAPASSFSMFGICKITLSARKSPASIGTRRSTYKEKLVDWARSQRLNIEILKKKPPTSSLKIKKLAVGALNATLEK